MIRIDRRPRAPAPSRPSDNRRVIAAPGNGGVHAKGHRLDGLESGQSRGGAHPWCKQDLAFQRSMMRAIACGAEKPPMIGMFKDTRPLEAPRLFEAVPHSSGC